MIMGKEGNGGFSLLQVHYIIHDIVVAGILACMGPKPHYSTQTPSRLSQYLILYDLIYTLNQHSSCALEC